MHSLQRLEMQAVFDIKSMQATVLGSHIMCILLNRLFVQYYLFVDTNRLGAENIQESVLSELSHRHLFVGKDYGNWLIKDVSELNCPDVGRYSFLLTRIYASLLYDI